MITSTVKELLDAHFNIVDLDDLDFFFELAPNEGSKVEIYGTPIERVRIEDDNIKFFGIYDSGIIHSDVGTYEELFKGEIEYELK